MRIRIGGRISGEIHEERTVIGYGSLLLDRPIASAYPRDTLVVEIGGVSYTTVIP